MKDKSFTALEITLHGSKPRVLFGDGEVDQLPKFWFDGTEVQFPCLRRPSFTGPISMN
jgi:hypothetical protein